MLSEIDAIAKMRRFVSVTRQQKQHEARGVRQLHATHVSSTVAVARMRLTAIRTPLVRWHMADTTAKLPLPMTPSSFRSAALNSNTCAHTYITAQVLYTL